MSMPTGNRLCWLRYVGFGFFARHLRQQEVLFLSNVNGHQYLELVAEGQSPTLAVIQLINVTNARKSLGYTITPMLTTFGTRSRTRIAQWNDWTLRESSRQAQLEVQMAIYNIDIRRICEMRWNGSG